MQNEKELAKEIVEKVGGARNIKTVTHCITRLRFVLKDKSKIDENGLRTLKEVLGIVDRGGQIQIVIGGGVERVFNAVEPLLLTQDKEEEKATDSPEDKSKENSIVQVIMSYVAASITPTITVIVGAGLINAILAVAAQFGLARDSGTFVVWSSFAQLAFTYLPVWIAISAARYLKTDSYLAAFITVSTIVYFSGPETLSMFGVNIPEVNYAGAIVPVLMMAPVLAFIDKFLSNHLHKNLVFMFKPLLSILVMLPLLLFIFGPLGALVGTLIVKLSFALMELGPISMAILAALHPITVIFGMHSLFTPILVNELTTLGYTYVLSRALAANFAMAGAALAVGVKSKKIPNKSLGISTSVTALLAATEPALYGVLLPLKRPLIASCAAAGVTGFFVGLYKVHAYSLGSFNLFTLSFTLGGDSMNNFYIAVGCALLAFVLGFVFTWLMGFKED
ncbi:PTS system beta-glucosides-specific IIC component [Trichococcus patagoniensis]|uniref:PTS system beta-glucosides-specific IIC component n=1 Tax=Trichococcus patagoniensis TaxID=382641 RepID=A0A2T5INP0_9LACT|nr:PTS transporter subunit EIIC [Trichococcus patagoniensis]PTQ85456.1 PTS system beta-glucosides-specific IIC component [Trichococcus patagoniensis]